MVEHNLNIISLNDGKAECTCGFYFVTVGEVTKEEIEVLHNGNE